MALDPLLFGQAVAQELVSLVGQDVPGSAGTQKMLRAIIQPVAGTELVGKATKVLADGDLDFVTGFTGPWRLEILSVTFRNAQGAPLRGVNHAIEIGWVLDGERHPIEEDVSYAGWSWGNSDFWDLAVGDQVYVHVAGGLNLGNASVAVRGVAR